MTTVETLSLAAVGDIMLGDHPVCFGHGIRSSIRRHGYAHMIADVADELRKHDVVFGNLECVLSDVGADERSLARSELRGDKSSVDLLRSCGVKVVSMANNHMLQHGVEAFNDTAAWLVQNGIRPVGLYESGLSNVVKFDHHGQALAILGFSLRPEHFCKDNKSYAHTSIDKILEQVSAVASEARQQAIVVSLHWGEEYLHVPSKNQIDFAHELVNCGATLILGHHPHVLQGLEEYRSSLIAYSLGNFMFDSWQKPTRESGVLSCVFERGGLRSFQMNPLFIQDNYTLRVVSKSAGSDIEAKMEQYSQAIREESSIARLDERAYQEVAAKAYLKYRMQCYWYFVVNFWKYEPRILFTSLFRSVLRRIGLA